MKQAKMQKQRVLEKGILKALCLKNPIKSNCLAGQISKLRPRGKG